MDYKLLKALGELEVINTLTNKKMLCSLKDVELLFDDGRHYLFVTQIEFEDKETKEDLRTLWCRDFKCDGSDVFMLKLNEELRKLFDENFNNGIMSWGDGTLDTTKGEIKHYWFGEIEEPHFCISGKDYDRFKNWYKESLPTKTEIRKKNIKKVLES